jgi:hypothetical protein
MPKEQGIPPKISTPRLRILELSDSRAEPRGAYIENALLRGHNRVQKHPRRILFYFLIIFFL